MTRHDRTVWPLAAALAAMAGYVDAIGFLKLGGLLVSFMSGNTTRLAVGIVTDPAVAMTALCLVAAFVCGVMAGTPVAAASGERRKPIVLMLVAPLLALAAMIDTRVSDRWTTMLIAAAMGATNTVFQRAGEVSIGVTYMTGTLVKLGQRLAGVLLGGARWAWLPYLMLWTGLAGGAVAGSIAWSRFGCGQRCRAATRRLCDGARPRGAFATGGWRRDVERGVIGGRHPPSTPPQKPVLRP